MSKQCLLNTLIDTDGMNNFYKPAGKQTVYDADSFFNVICDDAPYVGPTNQILLLDPNVTYVWQMQPLSVLANSDGSDGDLSITYFEFANLNAHKVDWNKIFDVEDSSFHIVGQRLVADNIKDGIVEVRTRKKLLENEPNLRLAYSIQFEFLLNGKKACGSIDPIIKNRNDDT